MYLLQRNSTGMDILRVPGQILRKLSVFYLFAVLLAGSLALYYWGIIPNNKKELNSRAHRVLNQITANFLIKDGNLSDLFSISGQNQSCQDFKQNVLTHYENFGSMDYLDYKSVMVKLADTPKLKKADTLSYLAVSPEGKSYWEKYNLIVHCANEKQDSFLFVRIPVRNMLSGLLTTRSDIFDSYLILENDTTIKQAETGSRPFRLLYGETQITHSAVLFADTLKSLLKNSDGSATAPLIIAGRSYTVFFRPFRLHNQRLILAGLIEEDTFSKKAHQTPIDFIPICLILIILILVALPISKVFLLSQKERISRIDVLGIAFSYYAGTIIICLVLFYTSHQSITGLTFSNRIRDLGTKIKSSVENTFEESNKRLQILDTLTQDSGDIVSADINNGAVSDRIAGLAGRHTRRLFWFDSAGQTIAKWNAFNFRAPNSTVRGSDFYESLVNHGPSEPNADFYIVTVGKSNVNEEFQVYLTRPSEKVFVTGLKGQHKVTERSSGIAEAMDLDISNYPVIPTGFGFYITDEAGNVLICNNHDRNLAENILEESGNNATLASSLRRRERTASFSIDLYGHSCRAMVWPLQGQHLNLVLYYDQHRLSANFMRMLLFGTFSLFFMLLATSLCVWLCIPKTSGIRRLRFFLNTVEWIQPTTANAAGYGFTFKYFLWQGILFLWFYLALSITGQSLEPLYACSILYPFYAVWAFFYSRIPVKPGETGTGIFTRCPAPPCFIVALNVIIGLVYAKLNAPYWAWTLSVQLVLFIILWLFAGSFKKQCAGGTGIESTEETEKESTEETGKEKQSHNYNASLMFSMVVCCIVPVAGILSYAYQAEKIQYKKEKLFSYAESMQQWERFVHNIQADGLKANFKDSLGGCTYTHTAYMTDGDFMQVQGEAPCKSDFVDNKQHAKAPSATEDQKSDGLPDNFYISVIDRFTDASSEFGSFRVIGDASFDGSWNFWQQRNGIWHAPTLEIHYHTVESGIGIQDIIASSRVRNILADFFQLPGVYIGAILIFFLLSAVFMRWLIVATTRRLFLIHFMPADLKADPKWLASLFDPNDLAEAGEVDWRNNFEEEFKKVKTGDKEATHFILSEEKKYRSDYNRIWLSLSPEERYILFDFAIDNFSSYKNLPILTMLAEKGILVVRDGVWETFSLSFKEFVLDKTDSKEIAKLEKKYRIAGNWAVLRVSILSLVAVAGILIIATQGEISHQVLATITSLTALLPLLARFLTTKTDDGTAAKSEKKKTKSDPKKDKEKDE
jgi:hypothetical protein